jgi:hypothetical protein
MALDTTNATNQATTAINNGNNATNNFDPNATANTITNSGNALNSSQTGTINDFINSYQNTVNAQPNLAQTYASLGQQYNIPQLENQATYLNNQVLKTPQNNLNLANGFNYSQGQVDQKTNQDLTKLQPLASAATTAFQNAQNLVNQGVTAQQTQNAYALLPTQAQQAMLSDQLTRQETNWTTANEALYNGLVAKMQSGVALSSAELQEAGQLAQAQASYQSAVASAQATENAATIGNNFITTAAGSITKNSNNGKILTNNA